jgi:uncharacterized membrane protein
MRRYVLAYIASLVAFAVLDLIWLTAASGRIYRPRIGALLLETPNLPAAVAFYLVYLLGMTIFATAPALRAAAWTHALIFGGLFGFFAYATYDLTNLATLRGWSASLSLIDIVWGTILTGICSVAGYWLADRF